MKKEMKTEETEEENLSLKNFSYEKSHKRKTKEFCKSILCVFRNCNTKDRLE